MNYYTLLVRSLSGIIYAIFMISALYYHPLWTGIFFCILFVLCMREYYLVLKKSEKQSGTTLFLFFIAGFFLTGEIISLVFELPNFALWGRVCWVLLLVFISGYLFIHKEQLKIFNHWIFGVLYIGIPFYLSIRWKMELYVNDKKALPIMYAVFLIWITDTFAYLGGSIFGRRPLLSSVSPKKTLEGTLMGVVCSVIFSSWMAEPMTGMRWYFGLLTGLILSLLSTTGDLYQSYLKRLAGVKDSGTLMPGHGGVWDRLDSFLFVIPAGYLIYQFLH